MARILKSLSIIGLFLMGLLIAMPGPGMSVNPPRPVLAVDWRSGLAEDLRSAGWSVENYGGREGGGGHSEPLMLNRIISRDELLDTLVVTAVVFKPDQRVRMTLITDISGGGRTGDSVMKSLMASPFPGGEPWCAAIVNAGYFDKAHRPMGLLRRDGKSLKTAPRGGGFLSNGCFTVAKGVPDICEFGCHAANSDLAIQSGPLLVMEGKVHPGVRKASLSQSCRTAIGIDWEDRVWLVVARSPLGGLSLRDEALMLARPLSRGGLNLRKALNLDGGSSTQLLFQIRGRQPVTRGDGRPLPAWLGVVFP